MHGAATDGEHFNGRHNGDSDIQMLAVGGYLDVSTSSIVGAKSRNPHSDNRHQEEMTNEIIDGRSGDHRVIRSHYQEKLALFDHE